MADRVTIMLDEDICIKIRKLQAKYIHLHGVNHSFSKQMNEVLFEGLKTYKV